MLPWLLTNILLPLLPFRHRPLFPFRHRQSHKDDSILLDIMPFKCPECKKVHYYIPNRGYPFGPDFIPTDSGRLKTNSRAKWCFDCCDEAKENNPEFYEVKEEARLKGRTELVNNKRKIMHGVERQLVLKKLSSLVSASTELNGSNCFENGMEEGVVSNG